MIDFYLFLPKELEEKINKNPLSIEAFEKILNSCEVTFSCHAKAYVIHSNTAESKVNIDIGLNQNQQEQQIGLVHEVTHCVYGAASWSILDLNEEQKKVSDSIELLIENEAQRFYQENKDFINATYEKLLTQNKAK